MQIDLHILWICFIIQSTNKRRSMFELAPYLPGFIAAYSILLIGAFSPGPSVAMLIGIATRQGRTSALVATFGIALGSVTINVMTMLGVGLILSQAAWAMSLLRIIGASYLLYLAYSAFNNAIRPGVLASVESDQRTLKKHLMTGYLLQVTNPKAIAFWLAITSVGAVEGAGFGIIGLFIFGAFLISFACHAAWALALSVNCIRSGYIAWRSWIEAALGCFFVFAAYKLSTSQN